MQAYECRYAPLYAASEAFNSGTLDDLASLVTREAITGPAIIIIGETAAVSARLPQRQEQFA